jgi:23S rRNA (guanosine2251-2'-O)-methyltransferase
VNDAPEVEWETLKTKPQVMVVALDGVEDPHNVGAILRTAWLMRAEALFVPESRAAHLTPSAVKVASGGAEHIPVHVEANLPSLLQSLKDMGFWIYGLSHKGERSFWQMEYPEKVAWVIGSESKGLRTPVERACDELVSIPQASAAASYNASVAAAIAMTETQRQWQSR